MKSKIYLLMFTLISGVFAGFATEETSEFRNSARVRDGELLVDINFVLDSIRMKSNGQMFLTPMVMDDNGNKEYLPTILVNGRNMQIAFDRKTIKRGGPNGYDVVKDVRRRNGKHQAVEYSQSVKLQNWMRQPGARIAVLKDDCGCGKEMSNDILPLFPLQLIPDMQLSFITPEVKPQPITIHEGRARVQFEVDRTVLHDEPYVGRNGQRIDNREQLQVIIDSIDYAISDPNVEIASIKIVGYASPESPYLHNMELSGGRSRALAEYLAGKYNLPKEKTEYDAVAENWKEFRDIAEKSGEITEQQRADLLELIDRPVYGPADYDAKEQELKTSKKFATLYRSLILPKWFPQLRATTFAINTRLKPFDDEKLAEIIEYSPELMTLNQMMRVARLYEEGSDQFNHVIEIALKYFPDDETANLNAAVAFLNKGDLDAAEKLLERAGASAEAENARGVLAVKRGDFDSGKEHFLKAGNLPEAERNLSKIEE